LNDFLLSFRFRLSFTYFGTEEGNALPGELENVFSLILVNPERILSVNSEDALLLSQWIKEKEAQQIIHSFGRENFGRPLFSKVNVA